ncbi:MAG: hypothetical protein HZB47_10885 [Nitrosomonadales bacterium]|nr:hypothetical protein [Nitrosomonadales bacterium]
MTTESKIYWSVGIVSLLILLSSFFYPADPTRIDDLPWHIEHPTPDSVRVFGLTLGKSAANDAELRFKEEAKPSLFKSPEGKMVAEVFFEQVNLGGLPSKVVLTIDVPEAELKGMYERGLRLASTGSGKKVTMTADDIARLRTLPIGGLTYLPNLRVEEAVFIKRFGQPAQRIKEKDSGLIHWLYPQNGLDITLGGGGKPLMQYVPPKDFDKLVRPLLAGGEVLK